MPCCCGTRSRSRSACECGDDPRALLLGLRVVLAGYALLSDGAPDDLADAADGDLVPLALDGGKLANNDDEVEGWPAVSARGCSQWSTEAFRRALYMMHKNLAHG